MINIHVYIYLFFPGFESVQNVPNANNKQYQCLSCGRYYKLKKNLVQHQRYECGKEPQFACHLCSYRAKQKGTLKTHIVLKHT